MAKEKSLAELRAEKAEAIQRAKEITEKAKAEARKLNDEEMKEHDELNLRIAEIGTEIVSFEHESRGSNVRVIGEKENKTPLLRAFREAAQGSVSEDMRALFNAGNDEMKRSGVSGAQKGFNIPVEARSLTAGVNTEIVSTEKQTILDPLRNELVFGKLGANVMTGLVGDIEIPSYSGSTSYWKGEVVAAQAGDGTFDSVVLAPKRLTTLLDVSMQFLIQDSVKAEEMLRRDLMNSLREKLESTAFGSAVAGDAPAGLLSGVLDYNGVDSNIELVKMIRDVKKANALKGSLGFVTNAEGEAKLLTTAIDPNNPYGFLANGDRILNYGYAVTEGMGEVTVDTLQEAGIIFANWQDFVVGQWGAINFLVDMNTLASEGMVRFVINSFWDFKFRRPESFVTGSIPVLA